MLIRLKYVKILKIAVCLFIATTAIFLLANFSLAANDDFGLNFAAGTGLNNSQDIRIIIAKIIRIAFGFLGIIAVVLIMYAGWLWMTSQGNEDKIEQAKKILTNAVIGLIIIISAFAIVSFILNKLVSGGGPGGGGPGGGGPGGGGISALGNGIIEAHYPVRDQKEVSRNVSIIITFREPIKANTACETTADKCAGENINKAVVRIFRKSQAAKCAIDYSVESGCDSLVETKVYSSVDGKTYVFAPKDYLGSPSEYIDYSVYLGSGLLRRLGEKAFPGLAKDYGWSFEVSNKIDLTPPQVKRGEAVPAPDNIKDITNSVGGALASGLITVNANPLIDQGGRVVSVTETGDSPAASAAVNKNCQRDGNFNIDIKDGPIATLYQDSIKLGQGTFGSKGNNKQAVFSECNLALTISQADISFKEGDLWNLVLNKAIAADIITAGNITYTASSSESGVNFKVGPTNEATAQSLVNILANNPDLTADRTDNVVVVTAKIAGAAGNNINLSSSNPSALAISAMFGGKDKVNNITINDQKDQPMNTAVQINFNEAIMPLTVSGTSDELKDYIKIVNADPAAKPKEAVCAADAECKSFICANGNCIGDNEYLRGKFTVSNQYSTVEFLSDKECGFNTCGEKIYCLPANSHLRVELSAADLITCADNSDCRDKSPFNICDPARKFCRDNENEYYPQADKTRPNIVNGLVDAAFNSLDGNRDGSAYGPASFYNENAPLAIGNGDNYEWSFFITDRLDLTPPKIKTTTPVINEPDVDLIKAIKISFDKLMLSSRLTTGSLTIQNGKDSIIHYLLNLRSFVDQPLGYWVTNVGRQSVAGGVIDQTDAYINHSQFSGASTYKAQAGSGLKDIHQNCFLPCSSQTIAGAPSCCNGAPTEKESCP
ncbi:MAG: hypothetical protein HYV53_00695 [Parcubacteria group bacterium]|nr:hypothetical protein [Parcubacteria group bacterium]